MFFKKPAYKDQELIKAIEKGGPRKELWIHKLYDAHMGFVGKGQAKYHLTREQTKDAYAEAIIGLVQQVEKGNFRGDSKVSTFLFRIFSNKCIDVLKKNKTNQIKWVYQVPDIPDTARSMLKSLVLKEETVELKKYMAKLGEVCQQILWDTEYHGYSLVEVAHRIGFKNAQSVASKKYGCLTRLKQMIHESKTQKTI